MNNRLNKNSLSGLSFSLCALIAIGSQPALASPVILSYVSASSFQHIDGYDDDESASENTSSTAGEAVSALSFACAAGCLNGTIDTLASASADARTNFGSNQARAYSGRNDDNNVNLGQARSFWTDDVAFTTSLLNTPTTTANISFQLDGNWKNYGNFIFNVGLYDPASSYYDPDAGGTFYNPVASFQLTNSLSSFPQDIPLFNVPNTGSGNDFAQLALVPGAGDESGAFDFTFNLEGIVNTNQIYVIYAELIGYSGETGAELDAYNTARLTGIALEPGVGLTSAANANYNVSSVPLPAAFWLFSSGLALLVSGAKYRRSAL